MSEHFSQIRARYLKRREFLTATAVAAASAAMAPRVASGRNRGIGFPPLPRDLTSHHEVAPGYTAQVLLRWGDPLDGPSQVTFPLSAEKQRQSFGFNNDFIAYFPLAESRGGLLCVNHEYSSPYLMFPGVPESPAAYRNLPNAIIEAEMAAVGHSVVEVARRDSGWQVVPGSRFARRITPQTPMRMDGPAAGDSRLQTRADPSGRLVKGTLACCSGGKTPWGTVLIAEENFGDVFSGDPQQLMEKEVLPS